jgi:hypothetical protein
MAASVGCFIDHNPDGSRVAPTWGNGALPIIVFFVWIELDSAPLPEGKDHKCERRNKNEPAEPLFHVLRASVGGLFVRSGAPILVLAAALIIAHVIFDAKPSGRVANPCCGQKAHDRERLIQ